MNNFEDAVQPGPHSNSGEQIQQRIISGTRWTGIGQAGTQLIRFSLSLLLARLLSPSEFGLMAMALVVIGLAELFKDLGTVSALVKVRELSPGLLNSVFLLNLLIGTLGYGIIGGCANPIARLFEQAELAPILRVLALTLVISSLGLTKRAVLLRGLKFGRLAGIDLAAALAQGLIAVTMALSGYGVWSLVVATLGSSIVTTVLLLSSSSWKPRLSFQREQMAEIVHFSLSMTGSKVFGYLITQADKLLIGMFLGPIALGLYSLAQRLMETVLSFITQPVSNVLFPAFSSIQDDNRQIASLYTKACGVIALVAFPVVAGMALLAEPFVAVVLAEKWRPLSPLMVILAAPAMVQALATTVGAIYLAKSKPHWLLGWQIAAGAITAASYFVGMRWGVNGVAVAYAISILFLAYPAFAIPFRLIELPVARFLKALLPCTIATALMLGFAFGVKALLGVWHATPLLELLLTGFSGAAAYFILILLLKVPGVADITDLLLLKRRRLVENGPNAPAAANSLNS